MPSRKACPHKVEHGGVAAKSGHLIEVPSTVPVIDNEGCNEKIVGCGQRRLLLDPILGKRRSSGKAIQRQEQLPSHRQCVTYICTVQVLNGDEPQETGETRASLETERMACSRSRLFAFLGEI